MKPRLEDASIPEAIRATRVDDKPAVRAPKPGKPKPGKPAPQNKKRPPAKKAGAKKPTERADMRLGLMRY